MPLNSANDRTPLVPADDRAAGAREARVIGAFSCRPSGKRWTPALDTTMVPPSAVKGIGRKEGPPVTKSGRSFDRGGAVCGRGVGRRAGMERVDGRSGGRVCAGAGGRNGAT